MTEIWNYLLRLPSRESAAKCLSSQGESQMAQVGFEPRPCRSQLQLS